VCGWWWQEERGARGSSRDHGSAFLSNPLSPQLNEIYTTDSKAVRLWWRIHMITAALNTRPILFQSYIFAALRMLYVYGHIAAVHALLGRLRANAAGDSTDLRPDVR
jgi:hypothetical protein